MEMFYSFACSAIGKTHLDMGTVLQDASDFYEDERCSVIAVSDGHGSENFPRSDRGSKFACAAAIGAVREFLDGMEPTQMQTANARDAAIVQLCKNILLRWNTAVAADAARDAFTEDEVAKVKEKYRRAYLAGEQVVHAYGATLLLAVLTQDFFLAVRNGDGECVTMDAEGHFAAPVPGNDKNEASFVTSLCDEDAIEDFRYFYTQELPAAVMLGSDGVENSYVHLEDLFSLYRNVCRKAAHEGGPATREEVERALSVITARGSGDDVSIACCLNLAQLRTAAPVLDRAAAQRQERLEEEKSTRQRQVAERTLEAKRCQLQEAVRKRDALHSLLQRLDGDKASIARELRFLASRQRGAEQDRAELSERFNQANAVIEKLREELQTLDQKFSAMASFPAGAPKPASMPDAPVPERAPVPSDPSVPAAEGATCSVPEKEPDGFQPVEFPVFHREGDCTGDSVHMIKNAPPGDGGTSKQDGSGLS